MKAIRTILIVMIGFVALTFTAGPAFSAAAKPLEFACSPQIYEAFGPELISSFTEKTGIPVNLVVEASPQAIKSVENEFADLAASTARLYSQHQRYGYFEKVFAKDPMVVFTNKNNKTKSLSKTEIQKIFSGEVNNWKEVGGGDNVIVTIVPDKNAGAYQNFKSLFMEGRQIQYDFMSQKSTMVEEAAKRFPYVISFITRAAVANEPELKMLRVDDVSPDDSKYPYYLTFSFVSKGNPAGAAAEFINYVTKGEGKEMLQKKKIIMLTDD